MNRLDLIDSKGNLVENAHLEIYTHCLFPWDPSSRRQAMLVARDESERFFRAGGRPRYSPSTLTDTIVTALSNDAGQRAVAGLVALAYSFLKANSPDKEITLYAAAKVVAKALKLAGKSDQRPLKTFHYRDGHWITEGQQCPRTQNGIESAWRDFCTVSHLIAADMILTEWFAVSSIFERPPEQTITLLRTAAVFEPHVRLPAEKRGHEILGVAHMFSEGGVVAEPLRIGNALNNFLAAGISS